MQFRKGICMFWDPVSQACQADTHWLKKLTKYSPSNVQMIFCFCFARMSTLKMAVPGLLGPKPFRPGTPRPKSIFLLGLLGPGLLGPGIKCFICGIQWITNVYLLGFYFNIRFSTIGKRKVKKESILSFKQMYFYFMWDISA